MPKTEVFDKYYKDYDNWFFEHELAYKAEINLIKRLIPKGKGLEVGVGHLTHRCHKREFLLKFSKDIMLYLRRP